MSSAEGRRARKRSRPTVQSDHRTLDASGAACGTDGGSERRTSRSVSSNTTPHASVASKSEIEAEMASLLDSTGLYAPANDVPLARGATGQQRARRKQKHVEPPTTAQSTMSTRLVPPADLYPAPEASVLDIISKTVEREADMALMVARLNALQPQRTLETLKSQPPESWPTMALLWKSLGHHSLSVDDLSDAFAEDMNVLRDTILRAYASVSNNGVEKEGSSAAPRRASRVSSDDNTEKKRSSSLEGESGQRNVSRRSSQTPPDSAAGDQVPRDPTTQEPFWSAMDPDDDVHTDSDEELDQRSLRFPPFVRPLRRVIRRLKRQEKLNVTVGRTLRSLDMTHHTHSGESQNVHEASTVLSETDGRNSRRELWREWDRAGRLALWLHSWRPSMSTSLIQRSIDSGLVTSRQLKSLEHFHVIRESPDWVPRSKLCWALFRYFAQHLLHVRDTTALDHLHESLHTPGRLPFLRSPFQWTIWQAKALMGSEDAVARDPLPCSVVAASPGSRFYVGRASTIWGSPLAEGYQHVAFPVEMFFWLRRCTGPLVPLTCAFRPRPSGSRVSRSLRLPVHSTDGSSDDSSALTAALELHTENATGPVDLSVRVLHEHDSSDSDHSNPDEESHAGSSGPLHQGCFRGYDTDCDVIRIGRFGRLRSSWEAWDRRRIGSSRGPPAGARLPASNFLKNDDARFGDRSVTWVMDSANSSEDSCTEYIEPQRSYRARARTSRQLLRSQRALIQHGLSATASKHDSRQARLLAGVYEDSLGPLEPPFVHPYGTRRSWPTSCVAAYQDKKRIKRARQDSPACANTQSASEDCSPIPATTEECWTYVTHKKGRVRGIQPNFNRCPASTIPLGFLASSTDLSGRQYHFVGVDERELWRRFGDNKNFQKNLYGYADLLKGTRDYYAIINEDEKKVTVVPGATLRLFWLKTPEQNRRDMHWYAFWRLWAMGRFRRRMTQKLLRYQALHKQGWFIWRQQLDKLGKVSERVREASAYREAKYTRLGTRYFSAARHDLAELACPTLARSLNDQCNDEQAAFARCEAEHTLLKDSGLSGPPVDTPLEVPLAHPAPDGPFPSTNPEASTNPSASLDHTATCPESNSFADDGWEEMDSLGVESNIASVSMDMEKEATRCAQNVEQEYAAYQYAALSPHNLPTATPSWAFGWRHQKNKLARSISNRYGPVVSRYYHKTLPAFSPTYRLARTIMAEKMQAEVAYSQQRKHTQQHREEEPVGSGSSCPPSLLTQQLSGALATLEETAAHV